MGGTSTVVWKKYGNAIASEQKGYRAVRQGHCRLPSREKNSQKGRTSAFCLYRLL